MRLCLAHLRRRAAELGTDPLSLQDLAEVAGMHPNELSRAFRQSLGLRPLEVALLMRLERSLTLLEHTELPIAEVALLCGFCGAPHYQKVFWFAFSVSPLRYREAALRGTRQRSAALSALEYLEARAAPHLGGARDGGDAVQRVDVGGASSCGSPRGAAQGLGGFGSAALERAAASAGGSPPRAAGAPL